ncbi:MULTISPECIES: branched-chain amino acid ABC transporter permease [Candidatus Ichthyocystis]|uniref:Branched chain amino acid transporter permease subunit n=1 Tax=Candidatus Ichthyocystis hellenicum TaxID=1561003 RepID=A0A0S4M475_9BURK|nr:MULTISPECIES: branched-chain amino acid ABC transporter permease [Ichthyocystis]CUT17514.1 branched chain amino acid transporter permease subunit [Candidatus Ichthyocystis hellenicum]
MSISIPLRIRKLACNMKPTIAIILCLSLPLMAGTIGQTWERNLDFILLYIIQAIGLNIILGYTGLLNLGFAAFYGCGAYCYALLASPHLGIHLPALVVLPISGLVAAILGLIVGAPALRLKGDYFALLTIGFGQVFIDLINNLNHPVNITNGPQGILSIDPFKILGIDFSLPLVMGKIHLSSLQLHYYLFLTIIIALIYVCHLLKNNYVGRAFMAIRENEIAARACGIKPYRYKMLSFFLGAFCSGVGGALFAELQGFVSPSSFNLLESFNILTIVILGGSESMVGIIASCVFMLSVPELLRSWLPVVEQLISTESQSPSWIRNLFDPEVIRQSIIGIAIVLMATFRPNGIFSDKRKLLK